MTKLNMRHSLAGGRISVASHPSGFTSKPWYPLTARVIAKNSIQQDDVSAAIRTQLGLDGPTAIEFRLMEVRYWGGYPTSDSAASGTPGETTMTVYDPFYHVTNFGRVLTEVKGFPDQVNRVALGYQYSIAQQNYALDGAATTRLVGTTNAASTGVLYFRLLWRVGG